MAYETLDEITLSQGIRKSWGNAVRSNFEDHEDRIGDAETAVTDLESRLTTIESDGPSNTPVYLATVTLTDAQIKALPTTGITIVSAPVLNQRVKLLSVTYYAWFQNGAYTNVDTTSAELVLQTTSGVRLGGYLANDSGVSLTSVTTLLAAASVLTVDSGPHLSNVAGTYIQPLLTGGTGSVDGKAVQLAATNNGAGNFTGGHASNRLTVVAYYSLETVPYYVMPFGISSTLLQRRPSRPSRRRESGHPGTPTPLL